MSTLSLEAIQQLLSDSRARGDYDTILNEFLKSDEMGIEVDLTSGPLAGKGTEKGSKNVVTGFKNASKRMNDDGTPKYPGAHQVQVVSRKVGDGENAEYHIFLINKAKLGQPAATTEEATA